MVRRIINIIALSIILDLFFISPVTATKTLVIDDAMLFDQEEFNNLDTMANELSDLYKLDIVIVTADDTNGKSSKDYADDFFDYSGFGVGADSDGILFLIDMDNREPYIFTTGLGIRYLSDERIANLIEGVFDNGLNSGDFYSASMNFLTNTKIYLEAGIPSGQYNEAEKVKNRITLKDLIISILGGILAAGTFFFTTKSRYKSKKSKNQFSYKSNSIMNLNSNRDNLIDSFVTSRIIPKPSNNNSSSNSSSGKSSTHTSSSGKTHGGGGSGGRKF